MFQKHQGSDIMKVKVQIQYILVHDYKNIFISESSVHCDLAWCWENSCFKWFPWRTWWNRVFITQFWHFLLSIIIISSIKMSVNNNNNATNSGPPPSQPRPSTTERVIKSEFLNRIWLTSSRINPRLYCIIWGTIPFSY